MSTVKIDFSEVHSASRKAKNVAESYGDYYNELHKKVYQKLCELPGKDKTGYIASSKDAVRQKLNDIKSRKSYFSNVSQKLFVLSSDLKMHENRVVSNISSAAIEAFELSKNGFWDNAVEWLYGTFCVDLSNWNPIRRKFKDFINRSLDWAQQYTHKIGDWFKHGNGRYYLNIFLDGLATATAVIGSVFAIAAAAGITAASGGAATPLLVAAIASSIGTIMTAVDTGFSIYNKVKALRISKESNDPGRARYYGNIGGVSDAIDKTDMGGKTANSVWHGIGITYDVTHVAADVVALISGQIGKAGLSGKRGIDPVSGKQVLETTYNPANVKQNLINGTKEKIGFRNVKGKWSWDAKNLTMRKELPTGTLKRQSILEKDIITKHVSHKSYKHLKTLKKIIGFPDKQYKRITNINKILDADTNTYDRMKSGLKIIGDTKFRISSPIKDINSTVIKVTDLCIDVAS